MIRLLSGQVQKRIQRSTKDRRNHPIGAYPEAARWSQTREPMDEKVFLPRAPRLQMRVPIAIRSSPRGPWQSGWTVNLSHSGVLATFASPTAISGDVEFIITLSRGALQGPGVPLLPDLHCRGQVVRRDADREGATFFIAANIKRQVIRAHAAKSSAR